MAGLPGTGSSLGYELSTHPDVLHLSQDASSTSVPLVTTKFGTTFRIAASKPTNLPSPSRVATDVTDHSH